MFSFTVTCCSLLSPSFAAIFRNPTMWSSNAFGLHNVFVPFKTIFNSGFQIIVVYFFDDEIHFGLNLRKIHCSLMNYKMLTYKSELRTTIENVEIGTRFSLLIIVDGLFLKIHLSDRLKYTLNQVHTLKKSKKNL